MDGRRVGDDGMRLTGPQRQTASARRSGETRDGDDDASG